MPDAADADYDLEFFWDPVCPFAWVTSRWVQLVVEQKGLTVDWRFIGLLILNEDKDYATEFPPGYPEYHSLGLRGLRVAAAVRAAEGREPMGSLYTALGGGIWNRLPDGTRDMLAGYDEVVATRAALAACGLAERYADHLHDESQDAAIRADTEDALARTGRDVGTPIVALADGGPAFFGPVISRVPTAEEAVELWDAVMVLANWPGFSEMKRTAREWPQVPLLTGETG
ncbi:MAG: DSBA oxidoreductase [Acidimicrobiales bacterium]|nr:MAG: DSBA oxidoreductase [Acidimicrobiales bacterium]